MKIRDIEEKIVVVLLILLIVLVFLAATLRWFGVQVAWSIDMAQLLFAWVCFIGADIALRKNKHVGVNLLVKRFPLPLQNGIQLINHILILGFLGLTFYYGVNLCIQNYARTFNTIPVSYSLVTLSAPVGAGLMALTIVGRVLHNFKNIINRDYSSLIKEESIDGGQV